MTDQTVEAQANQSSLGTRKYVDFALTLLMFFFFFFSVILTAKSTLLYLY